MAKGKNLFKKKKKSIVLTLKADCEGTESSKTILIIPLTVANLNFLIFSVFPREQSTSCGSILPSELVRQCWMKQTVPFPFFPPAMLILPKSS